ncbi:MAG: diguanylate cyclase [Rhodospirillales bacterium]|nr:diguanylate cyclase [Rhodospirillales bacterium]
MKRTIADGSASASVASELNDAAAAPHTAYAPETILDAIGSLERAMAAQTEWLKDWHLSVVCRNEGTDFVDSMAESCPAGAWYHGDVPSVFSAHPCFKSLGERLDRMAAHASLIARKVPGGTSLSSEDYSAFMNTVLDFNGLVQQIQHDTWEGLYYVDPLTGIRNRQHMGRDLEAERHRSKRNGTSTVIAMIDMDHFKAINDDHGHQAGDRVLKGVADILMGEMRLYDMLYRYGGEEFLICLPNTGMETGRSVLERLRQQVEKTAIDIGNGKSISVTATFGYAPLIGFETVENAIDAADNALYEGKKKGRNRVNAASVVGIG